MAQPTVGPWANGTYQAGFHPQHGITPPLLPPPTVLSRAGLPPDSPIRRVSASPYYHTAPAAAAHLACHAGLGYYRRARYLLDGAKYIVGECGGRFPTTAKELQAIPGEVANC